MKPEHRKNLETLRDYLRSGKLLAAFDMAVFNEYGTSDTPESTGHSECGSVGCAVGHATLCIEPLRFTEDWHQYSERLFGVTLPDGDEWEWLFGPAWEVTDNTPEGAADRIAWYLERGLPKNWAEQMEQYAPLCYRQGA